MTYSSFWRRAVAAIIDTIVISAISVLLARVIFFLPVSLFFHFFYKPIFEASRVRATPGKYLAEISVERSDGRQLTLKDAYIRYVSSWVSGLTLGIGFLMALFTKKHQTLHDIFADTVVVDKVYDNDGLWNEWWATIKFLFSRKEKKH